MNVLSNRKIVLVLSDSYGNKETVIGVKVSIEDEDIPTYFIEDEDKLSSIRNPDNDVELIYGDGITSNENVLQAVDLLGWAKVEPVFTKYNRVQHYGGAEEGGWYYHNMYPVHEVSKEEFLQFSSTVLLDEYGEGFVYECGILYGEDQKTSKEYYC
jgi:hypothetical protein